MAHTWDIDRSSDHIKKRLEEVKEVDIVDYVRDKQLENIPVSKAYKVNGVHLYADILNLGEMLHCTKEEGVQCHQRTLRFVNLDYRAVSRILSRTATQRVDFHNQRLHAVVTKPYNTEEQAESKRIHRAIAIGQLIIDVLSETDDSDEHIPAAKVRIGIDSGKALAVNNGRKGSREPLFLGEPANEAAKIAAGDQIGIYLTNTARRLIGLKEQAAPNTVPLTQDEVSKSQQDANLDVNAETIVAEWRDDLKANPIGVFEFSRHTPPFSTMEIEKLTPVNSRRQEAVSIYADIDGFSAYVKKNIDNNPKDVVRTLHVLRAELERTLSKDFEGRRIRFIGDCLHGLLCEGTAQITDEEATVSTATLCAGGLRSGFENALNILKQNKVEIGTLGLAVGFELGPMTITRLGIYRDLVRCSVSRGVLAAENEQRSCDGTETAIGEQAYKAGSAGVRDLFTVKRKARHLDFNEAAEALSEKKDKSGQAAKQAAFSSAPAAIARASEVHVRPHAKLV